MEMSIASFSPASEEAERPGATSGGSQERLDEAGPRPRLRPSAVYKGRTSTFSACAGTVDALCTLALP
jgi:hypothetical protein